METNDCQQIMETSENDLSPSPQPDPNQSVESVESIESDDNDDNDDNDIDVTDELNTSKTSNTSNDNTAQKKKKKRRKMTPLERKAFLEERKRRQEEREAQKEKRSQELKEKKELLEKQKLEKQMEKEKRDKERLEKEAEKQRIKDEKQKEKEEKQKEREDKLKEKEAERLKKLEECQIKKRKLDEDNARKEEEKRKKCEKEEKQKSILKNFFIKKSSDDQNSRRSTVISTETIANGLFLPFHLGENQTLAPIVRESAKNRFDKDLFDSLFESQDSEQLYLDSLKNVDYKPLNEKRQKTDVEPDVVIESQSEADVNQPKRYRVKHLQFHQNVRPPYRGTFSKTSAKVKPTQPFSKDSDIFDYEVDSDEEWEEGGPGESLDGSDSEGSVKDDYEIDNDFFVPHGYLSEDENDENEDKGSDNIDNDVPMNEDNGEQKEGKCRPLLKEQVLMAERNRSFSKTLIPIVIGCVWESDTDTSNKKSIDSMQSYKRVQIVTK